MCAICNQTPCASACPEAPDQETVLPCRGGCDGIFDDEDYIKTEDGYMCLDCLESLSTKEVLEVLGIQVHLATIEE